MKISGNPELSMSFEKPDDKETFDAFIIIAGSGKVDRNGNAPKMPFNMYKQLSDYLLTNGIATLRYDKRGVGKSKGDFYTTGLEDLLYDVGRAVDFLHNLPQVKRIFLLGHSEGCILASLFAEKHKIDGMILLSGAGVSLKTAMMTQNVEVANEVDTLKGLKGIILRLLVNKEKIKKNQQKIFNAVSNTSKDTIKYQLVKYNAKWMREHFYYSDSDIQIILENLDIPIMAATGTKDVQANVDDLNVLDNFNKENIIVKRIENMDHMLRTYNGNKTILGLKKQYKDDLKKPLSPELLTEIGYFLKSLDI